MFISLFYKKKKEAKTRICFSLKCESKPQRTLIIMAYTCAFVSIILYNEWLHYLLWEYPALRF